MSTIKEMVQNDQRFTFEFYRSGNLWYSTESGFEFPVPISDAGNATFKKEDRAMLFMRYIRKHLKLEEEAKTANHNEEANDG